MVGHLYILKIRGALKLRPVVLHVLSPKVKIEVYVEYNYFYQFEIFQQIVFYLSNMI